MDNTNEYIWQRRIHHGVRYQKGAVPFPDSVEIGLEFNVALERKEKLDMCLLTNGVMLEICEFAKAVTRSERNFLFEMLEFNFDLGVDVDNDWQCYDYSRRIHSKIKLLKEQIKWKPHRWKEMFILPDLNTTTESAGSEQPGRYCPKRNTVMDYSVLSEGGKKSTEHQNSESKLMIKKPGGVQLKLTDDAYPFCRALGVNLVVRPDDAPKEKLDPNLITNGVMMELLDFSRALCGTHSGIVRDLVQQNFGHKLVKTLFSFQVTKLTERKNACLTAEDRSAFRKEVFQVQPHKREQKSKKRKYPDADYQELKEVTMAGDKKEMLMVADAEDIGQSSDLSYMCPVDFETDVQSDLEAEPEKMKFLNEALVVKEEEVEVCVSPVQPHNLCSFNVSLKNTVLQVMDLFSEDNIEEIDSITEKKRLWIRRATRSKEILKSSRVNDKFAHCRERGLDFNIGSGSKQNLDPQLFTNWVMWEVYKFALAMTKSSRNFLFDMLGNNFNLVFQNEVHQRNFASYINLKEKTFQNHPDRWDMEFLNSPFQLPETYNMVDVTSDFQPRVEDEAEQQTNGHSSSSAASHQTDVEPHPFCEKLGLNLWSTEERPASQKLDLTVLTIGAVLEMFAFSRELCGSLREMVNDILEHNFDLDLHSGATEASQVIQRWYATQKSVMKRQTTSPKVVRWLNKIVPLNGELLLAPQPPTVNVVEDLDSEDLNPEMEAVNGDVELEEKMVDPYHFCKEIGLDLDVRSKPKGKRKLDLRVLTRGVLFEMHKYVEQNCNRYVPALYEILEHNFDLSSQSHRRVEFAWSIAAQVITIAGKNGRKGDYLNKVIELPVEDLESSWVVCKEEPDDGFVELDLNDNNDIMFVRELKPVDILVEID